MTSETKIAPSTMSTPIADAFVTALKMASPCPNRFRVLARNSFTMVLTVLYNIASTKVLIHLCALSLNGAYGAG